MLALEVGILHELNDVSKRLVSHQHDKEAQLVPLESSSCSRLGAGLVQHVGYR